MSNTNSVPTLDLSRFQASVPRSEFLSRMGELTAKVEKLTTAYNKLSDDFAELEKLVKGEPPVEEKPVKQEKPKTETKPKPQAKQPAKSQAKK